MSKKKGVIDQNRIDIGKIIALRRAGWSVTDIAEEMHISEKIVQEVIYWYVAKHQKAAT